ncbi:DUF192 domain-containing protein [Candidatus Pacearchaeota archaeon]|nr:DUF192 domain-containing protein [Candidatus Pacearchaeota archaeon]
MKKSWTIIIVIIILIGFFIWSEREQPQILTDGPKVCFGETCFNVEIVDTPAEREIGLMNRVELDSDSGMLFVFENEGYYPFWMKNTLIPLDMIWIDKNNSIIDIRTALPCEADPCEVISPSGDALYVLEINADIASEKRIITGMQAEFINLN